MPNDPARPTTTPPAGERPLRVVLVNQYCYPDVASTGHLIHDLAIELAGRGLHVEVLTTQPSYGDKSTWVTLPKVQVEHGVTFRRVWVPRVSKNVLAGRAIKDLTFLAQLGVRMLLGSRRDTVYLYTTAPPYGAVVGALVGMVRKHTYATLLYDSYPQLATWVGTFKKGSLIERVWHRVNRLFYGRASEAIVLCKAAKRLVCEHYPIPPERVHVIPNWAPPGFSPVAKRETAFAAEHGLNNEFVLLYSGNMGLYYDFATVLDAAERLAGEPFRLVLVGGGGKRAWVEEEVRRRNLGNVLMLPYQPFETLNDSLNGCDASLVTISEGIEGISFPSKLYTSLAVGKAIVALSEDWSELREKVEASACGVWSPLGDGDALAGKIRGMMADPAAAAAMGERARDLFELEYTREVSAGKYEQALRLADPAATERERADRRARLRERLEGAAMDGKDRLRVLIVTEDDPLYVVKFFEVFFAEYPRDRFELVGITVDAAFHEPIWKTARRMWGFYGPRDFLRVGMRYARVKAARRSIGTLAARHGVPAVPCVSVNDPAYIERVRALAPDVIVSVAAPEIFRKDILTSVRLGCVNIHSGRLPIYRGMMPNFWQLLHEEPCATVTVHEMVEKLDAGGILGTLEVPIRPVAEGGDSLDRLIVETKRQGARLMIDVLDRLRSGTAAATPIDMTHKKYFSFPKPEDVQRLRALGHRML